MKNNYIGRGILLGVFTSIVVIVLAYLVNLATGLSFPPFSLFDFLTRVLPGAMVTFGIDFMVSVITALQVGPTSEVAKLAEQSTALILFLILGGGFGAILGYLGRGKNSSRLHFIGLAAGLGLWLVFSLIGLYLRSAGRSQIPDLIWLALLFGGWGWALGWIVRGTVQANVQAEGDGISRREALYLGGTALAALLASAAGLGFLFTGQESGSEGSGNQAVPTPPSRKELGDRIPPAPGTRPEITSNADFYRIDINTVPPSVDGESWRLELGGLVENPMTLTLEDIRARPAVSEYITLSCISNRVGGDLISTTLWTGISLKDLLEEASLMSGAQELAIESEDGFYESVSMQDMMDPHTLLVYEMNGEPLPVEHGFPLRIYIPNHYGMKQPKWITKMEVIDHQGDGYWVDRGWSEEAIVMTTSVVDNVVVQQEDGQVILSGGIAYAGSRRISRVEVRIDEGSWDEAELRTPPLSSLTWIQWRYQMPAPPAGEHLAQVRAYDGNNELQVVEENMPHPDGATGIDSYSFKVA